MSSITWSVRQPGARCEVRGHRFEADRILPPTWAPLPLIVAFSRARESGRRQQQGSPWSRCATSTAIAIDSVGHDVTVATSTMSSSVARFREKEIRRRQPMLSARRAALPQQRIERMTVRRGGLIGNFLDSCRQRIRPMYSAILHNLFGIALQPIIVQNRTICGCVVITAHPKSYEFSALRTISEVIFARNSIHIETDLRRNWQ